MKKKSWFAMVAAVLTLTTPAFAGWSSAHVTYVWSDLANTTLMVNFDGAAFTGCASPNAIQIDLVNYPGMTQAQLDALRSFFVSGQVSGKQMEISTNGCLGNGGKLLNAKLTNSP